MVFIVIDCCIGSVCDTVFVLVCVGVCVWVFGAITRGG